MYQLLKKYFARFRINIAILFIGVSTSVFGVPQQAHSVTLLIESTVRFDNTTTTNVGDKIFGLVQYETGPSTLLFNNFAVSRFEILFGGAVIDINALNGTETNQVSDDAGIFGVDTFFISEKNFSGSIAAFGEVINDFGATVQDLYTVKYENLNGLTTTISTSAVTSDLFEKFMPSLSLRQRIKIVAAQ